MRSSFSRSGGIQAFALGPFHGSRGIQITDEAHPTLGLRSDLPRDDLRVHPIGIQQSPLPNEHALARFSNSFRRLWFGKQTTMDTETISTIQSKSDAELMEAVGRRESDAIQEIYKRYESTLRSVIQSVLHDEGETDD